MGAKIYELNARDAEFVLDGKTYHLRKFDLNARVWAHDEFKTEDEQDGLKALAQRLQNKWNDLPAVSKTVFHLIKEKDLFGTYESFIDAIEKAPKNTNTILIDLYNALNACLGASEPSKDEIEEDEELKKSRAVVR